jgi:hypothetical protein
MMVFRTDFSRIKARGLVAFVIGIAFVIISLAGDQLGYSLEPAFGYKQIAILGLGVPLIFYSWCVNTNSHEFYTSWKSYLTSWLIDIRFSPYLLLLLGGLSHLLGITTLSLITPFSPLEDRLLSPSLSLLMIAALGGLYRLINLVSRRGYQIVIFLAVLIIGATSPAFLKTEIAFQPGFQFPPEQELWNELYSFQGIDRVTHFYSDHDFRYQIYANRPQRVILEFGRLIDVKFLKSIMKKGRCPFIVVRKGDKMGEIMDIYYLEAGLIRREMVEGKFVLYHQSCLTAGN